MLTSWSSLNVDMDVYRLVFLLVNVLMSSEGTVTVTESSGTNTVTSGGALKVTCSIQNWQNAIIWNIPAYGSFPVCLCQNGGSCSNQPADTRITCEVFSGGVALKIANTYFTDRGEYKCIHFATPQETGELAVTVQGTVTVTESSGTNAVTKEGSLVLTCNIDNWTQGVYWNIPAFGASAVCICQHGGPCTPPAADTRITCEAVTGRVYMNIANVAFSDRGQYKCIHFVSPQESGQLSITVQVPISSVEVTSPSTSPVTVTEGTRSDLVCKTSQGFPRATITWYKQLGSNAAVDLGGGSTVEEGGPQVVTKSTLQFTPTRTDHGYRIYCTAYNIDQSSVKTSSNNPQLVVNYAPETLVIASYASGSDFFILDGKPQTLTCSVQGGRPTPALSWNCFNGNMQDKSSGTTVAEEITWTAAEAHDGQRCTCQLRHQLSNRQVFVVIIALYPPSIPTFTVGGQFVPGPVSVIEGRSISVTCSSTSSPSPNFTWSPRGSSQSDNVVTLSGVQTDITCTCTVSNTMTPSQGDPISGSNSSSITVNVLYPPRTQTLRYDGVSGQTITSPFNVIRGDDFDIYCGAVGNPGPSYKWSGQSANNEKLSVTNVQTDTSWTCTATNTMRPTAAASETRTSTADASVIVLYGPSTPSLQYYYSTTESVTLQNGVLQVIKGKSFDVKCSGSDSRPPADYKWSCAYTSQAGTLTVDNIGVPSDGNSKVCTCTASNSMARTYGQTTPGTSTRDMTINVLYAPEVASLRDEIAVENATFSKSCTATPGNPSITQYKWTKDGSTVVQQQTLTISKISRTNAGKYRCMAINDMQPTGENAVEGNDSKTVSLIVHYSASITAFTINNKPGEGPHTLTEKSTIRIRCQVESNPGSRITISKDGSALSKLDDANEVDHTITRASCLDAGRYSCAAYNQYNGDVRPDVSGQVFVQCPPRAIDSLNNYTYYRARNTSVTLNLTFTAYPPPTSLQWLKQLPDASWEIIRTGISSNHQQSNLTLQLRTKEEFGQYKIEITNDIGEMEHLVYVSEHGLPAVPRRFRMVGSLNKTIFLWESGSNGGYQQKFIIEVSQAGQNRWTEKLSINEWDENHRFLHGLFIADINGLDPGSYTARVLPSNKLGKSEASELPLPFIVPQRIEPSSESLRGTSVSAGAVVGGVIAGIEAVVIAALVFYAFRLRRRYLAKNDGNKESKLVSKPNHPQTTLERNETYDNIVAASGSSGEISDAPRNVYEQLNPGLGKERVYSEIDPSMDGIRLDVGAEYINLNVHES